MKLLFISMLPLENNTSATIQNLGVIRGMHKLGHVCDTLTLYPNKNSISYDESNLQEIKKYVNKQYYLQENRAYSQMSHKKQEKQDVKNLIKKLLKIIYKSCIVYDAQKMNCKLIKNIEINYRAYDYIISFSDPKSSHLLAYNIIKKDQTLKEKWIQYWGDPWLIDMTRKKGLKDILVKYHEKKLLSLANRIIYVSPFTLEEQKKVYPVYKNKMYFVNQCANDCEINEENYKNQETTVGYLGAYQSTVRNIIPLYQTFNKNKQQLLIVGSSDIKLEESDNVKILTNRKYSETKQLESKMDILVCICNKRGTQIPGKIYYCASYEKPILVIVDGEYSKELKKYFEKFERYIIVDNDINSISQGIKLATKQILEGKWKHMELNSYLKDTECARQILGDQL